MRTSTVSELSSLGFSGASCPVTREVMPNMVRAFDGFHISYCRHQSHYGSDTTALVLQGRVFFILSGYHADALVQAAEDNGIQGCISAFIERIEQANPFSEHRQALLLDPDPFQVHSTTLEVIGQDGFDRLLAALPVGNKEG